MFAWFQLLVEPKRMKNKNYLISDTIVVSDQERCVVRWRCIRYLEEWGRTNRSLHCLSGGKTIIDIQDGKCRSTPRPAATSSTSRFGRRVLTNCRPGLYRPWGDQ